MRRLFASSICRSCRSKLLRQPQQPFATFRKLRAPDEPPQTPPSTTANAQTPPGAASNTTSLFQSAGDASVRQRQEQQSDRSSDSGAAAFDELIKLSNSNSRPLPSRPRASVNGMLGPITGSLPQFDFPSLTGASSEREPFVLHIITHKHNTHLTLSGPFPSGAELRGPHDRRRSISVSAGNIGLRKAGRSTFDAGFQLAAFVFKAINERDILPLIQDNGLEVRYRGFGKGREAVTKALLGQEGRWLRGKVIRVSDVTALKFGGVRSKKPRRL